MTFAWIYEAENTIKTSSFRFLIDEGHNETINRNDSRFWKTSLMSIKIILIVDWWYQYVFFVIVFSTYCSNYECQRFVYFQSISLRYERLFFSFFTSFFFIDRTDQQIERRILCTRLTSTFFCFLSFVNDWWWWSSRKRQKSITLTEYSSNWYFIGSLSCLIAFDHLIRTCMCVCLC